MVVNNCSVFYQAFRDTQNLFWILPSSKADNAKEERSLGESGGRSKEK